MSGSVIIGGARTPIGKMAGGLSSLTAMDLGGVAIKAALERAGVGPERVEYVIMGHVILAGCGQNPARPAAVAAGIPLSTPSITVNKVCLSGVESVHLADMLIQAGEYDIVVAGGMESMSQGPYLLPDARKGYKFGPGQLLDATAYDGLWSQFDGESMGAATERYNKGLNISREEQDEYAARSHERAAAAMKGGLFDEEIVPTPVPQRKGDPIMVTEDEGVRPGTTAEGLSKLKPAFAKDGTITAGSASQVSDGGSAVVMTSRAMAEKLGAPILAEIGAYGTVAGPDTSLQSQPANASQVALRKEGISVSDVDLFEFNEAFAAVAVQSSRQLNLPDDKVNVNGGAISLGHPVGASGNRIILHLALELGRRGGGTGVAAICGGGGQGDALVLKVPARS